MACGSSWERRQVGPGVGPTSALYSCILIEIRGPTCIFWANLTPFSLRAWAKSAGAHLHDAPPEVLEGEAALKVELGGRGRFLERTVRTVRIFICRVEAQIDVSE